MSPGRHAVKLFSLFFIVSALVTGQNAQASEGGSPKDCPELTTIGFQERILGDENAISLSFDDGPDGENGTTERVLDVLQHFHVKASFFVCGHNWVDLEKDVFAQNTIRRTLADGHELGNHTSTHRHLPSLTDARIEEEISSTETLLNRKDLFGENLPPVTLLRAPYGQPFEADPVNVARVGAVFAKHGAHIGWNINSYDWACETSVCVAHNVLHAIDQGQRGVVLMHSNYQATVDALPEIIEGIEARGLQLVGIEDLVKLKYGVDSATLLTQTKAYGER